MKVYILGFISLFLSACVTVSGSYIVGAYDKSGMALNNNMELTTEGSGIYTVRNALCATYPGAIVKIIDQKTGQDLKSESPYQCSGKAKVIKHPFNAPKQIYFLGVMYGLVSKQVKYNGAIYEYTANSKPIDHWTTLITLLYNKDISISPEEWINLSNEQTVKPLDSHISDGHAYTQTIFKPTNKYRYFETAVKKTFHLKACNGLVTYSYAKKYPTTEKLETIINENHDIFKVLEMEAWAPPCNAD